MSALRILVGYTAPSTGKDALSLGIALARQQNAELQVTMIAPEASAYSGEYPRDRSYNPILQQQLQGWIDEALKAIPGDVNATGRVVFAESDVEGLLQAANTFEADEIVIGSRRGGLLRRHTIGSVATALLHSAEVPVILAPTGYQQTGPISRITAMFGPRPGAPDIISNAIHTVRKRDIPLRLVSLVMLDAPQEGVVDDNTKAINLGVLNSVSQYADSRLAAEADELLDEGKAKTVIATGSNVETAMEDLNWDDNEMVLVGSSRLAAHGRLFMGSTAGKMLRSTPIPMAVIPAGYTRKNTED